MNIWQGFQVGRPKSILRASSPDDKKMARLSGNFKHIVGENLHKTVVIKSKLSHSQESLKQVKLVQKPHMKK